MRTFYAVSAIIGTWVAWVVFGSFFALDGIVSPALLRGLVAKGAASGSSADVLLSILVFCVWSWRDARDLGLRRWWLVLPAGCTVGLSLALPLYLWMREGRMGPA